MTIKSLFSDKTIKAKAKVETLSQWLLDKTLPLDELMAYGETAKAAEKASFIEAIEFATRQEATMADISLLQWLLSSLSDDAPRVKWESAKVIGHIAYLFPKEIGMIIERLKAQTDDEGTVVRWAVAFALGEILKLNTPHNKTLLPFIESLAEIEKENGVKKKYIDAVKKLKKSL